MQPFLTVADMWFLPAVEVMGEVGCKVCAFPYRPRTPVGPFLHLGVFVLVPGCGPPMAKPADAP